PWSAASSRAPEARGRPLKELRSRPIQHGVARVSGTSWMRWLIIPWGMAAVAGSVLLWSYKLAPGAVGAVPPTWPAASSLPRTAGRATVVLFAHPRCPCTRASLAELGALTEELGPEVDVVIAAAEFAGVAETAEFSA